MVMVVGVTTTSEMWQEWMEFVIIIRKRNSNGKKVGEFVMMAAGVDENMECNGYRECR